ncbi:hypothetical protein L218DRAFT_947441 [Marasmius fiardii PR-910]|nr:hypothetical protein L218DRAFT_947441 [Marasmius fiardii PR-910]
MGLRREKAGHKASTDRKMLEKLAKMLFAIFLMGMRKPNVLQSLSSPSSSTSSLSPSLIIDGYRLELGISPPVFEARRAHQVQPLHSGTKSVLSAAVCRLVRKSEPTPYIGLALGAWICVNLGLLSEDMMSQLSKALVPIILPLQEQSSRMSPVRSVAE